MINSNMVKLENVVKIFNEFQCAAISAEYNTWEQVDLKPVTEELIKAIEKYVTEIEQEKETENEKHSIRS